MNYDEFGEIVNEIEMVIITNDVNIFDAVVYMPDRQTQDACKNKITNVNDRRYANKENEEIIVRGSERNKNKTN
jgi:hypothetical protein